MVMTSPLTQARMEVNLDEMSRHPCRAYWVVARSHHPNIALWSLEGLIACRGLEAPQNDNKVEELGEAKARNVGCL